jgi:hypothetical protein
MVLLEIIEVFPIERRRIRLPINIFSSTRDDLSLSKFQNILPLRHRFQAPGLRIQQQPPDPYNQSPFSLIQFKNPIFKYLTMAEPSKFAIHEAARDGRSEKTPAINPATELR